MTHSDIHARTGGGESEKCHLNDDGSKKGHTEGNGGGGGLKMLSFWLRYERALEALDTPPEFDVL